MCKMSRKHQLIQIMNFIQNRKNWFRRGIEVFKLFKGFNSWTWRNTREKQLKFFVLFLQFWLPKFTIPIFLPTWLQLTSINFSILIHFSISVWLPRILIIYNVTPLYSMLPPTDIYPSLLICHSKSTSCIIFFFWNRHTKFFRNRYIHFYW